ncbi:MAG: FAD-dependent oxidoreductase [Pseudomonadota bacterium]|nr:FAD-dependent oxidoreductase [Pseudomonadota bacterium]
MKHIAVIGSGISGLATAWLLQQSGQYHVTLLEAADYFGGHSNAVDVNLDGITYPVDTGFLVFNHKTYPNLTALFQQLGVKISNSDMSFAVSLARGHGRTPLEWAGDSLNAVFAQRRNVFNLKFWHMLADIIRFGQQAERYLAESKRDDLTLGQLLDRHGYSQAFQTYYLLPMGAAIWSTAVQDIRQFPASSFLHFCLNHVLLSLQGRPQWKTVTGSSRQYVQRILGDLPDCRLQHAVVGIQRTEAHVSLQIQTPSGLVEHLTDQVVFACHSDQTLAILGQHASDAEQQILAAIRYAPNQAFLHTDTRQLPQHRGIWASWNYLSDPKQDLSKPVAVTYWLNRLQPLPFRTPLMVTLNPVTPIDPSTIIQKFDYAHPQMDRAALAAQQQLHTIQGVNRCYFAGAWGSFGFHEDGLKSAIRVAHQLGVQTPWPADLS